MAVNKSKRADALFLHAVVYSACFSWLGLEFFCLTFLTHYWTDFVTSRIISRLWFFKDTGVFYNVSRADNLGGDRFPMFIPVGGSRHWFFVVIGFDQLIHFATLTWTLHFLEAGAYVISWY